MKYSLIFSWSISLICIPCPSYAQFSSFPVSADSCTNVCLKFDVGSANNIDAVGFNNTNSSNNNNNLRWQASITWRLNPPEVVQAEAERVKQRLEDNKTLITNLAEAIAQNKPELARGIAIILAPRLNYQDPKVLIAELKEGTINLGRSSIDIKKAPIKVQPSLVKTLQSPSPNESSIILLQ